MRRCYGCSSCGRCRATLPPRVQTPRLLQAQPESEERRIDPVVGKAIVERAGSSPRPSCWPSCSRNSHDEGDEPTQGWAARCTHSRPPALHVSRWRLSTLARFDAEELHPAERREVVVFNRRCTRTATARVRRCVPRVCRASRQATPIEATAPCGELPAACNAALNADLNSCLQTGTCPTGSETTATRARVAPSAPVASVTWGAARALLEAAEEDARVLEADAADAVAPAVSRRRRFAGQGGACQQTHVHGVPKRRKNDEGEPG